MAVFDENPTMRSENQNLFDEKKMKSYNNYYKALILYLLFFAKVCKYFSVNKCSPSFKLLEIFIEIRNWKDVKNLKIYREVTKNSSKIPQKIIKKLTEN